MTANRGSRRDYHLTHLSLPTSGQRSSCRGFTDQPSGIIDDDHCAVIEICNALVILFALFEDKDPHRLTGQYDRLESVSKFVDVQDGNAAKLRDFVEIKIIGNDDSVELLSEFDQFQVDLFDCRKIGFDDLYIESAVIA